MLNVNCLSYTGTNKCMILQLLFSVIFLLHLSVIYADSLTFMG